MKKLIATLLTMSLAVGMGATAFAAAGNETVGENGSQPIDVTARYTDGTSTDTTYSVDIAWDDMTFTYHESGSRTWNPSNHTYMDNTTAGWDKTTADITVTNHSNADVDIDLTYAPVTGTGVNGALDTLSYRLAAGEEDKYTEADSRKSTFTISGAPDAAVTADGVKVGTITVAVSAAN